MKYVDRMEDLYMSIEKMKVEDKIVHEASDVSLISAVTIESLLKFMDLEPGEHRYA